MSQDTIGVAVIGAGMAGKAHAAGYRTAAAVYASTLPRLRLVSIGDVVEPLGRATAERFGFDRHDTDWRAIAADDSIQVVSVVVANTLHREIVEGLLAAGKHVLCEKPLSDTIESARAMAGAARASQAVARIGFSFRRAPGLAFVRDLVLSGRLGDVLHVSGRYWTDYGAHRDAPMSWRYQGPPGSGALADVGSHLSYIVEFVGGDIERVRGGQLSTVIAERPEPIGTVVGHTRGAVSETTVPVENDDYAACSFELATGGAGTFEVSRVAVGHPNSLYIEVFGSAGAARWDQRNPSEVEVAFHDDPVDVAGYRTVQLGGQHPYIAGGLPMDATGVGIGQNDMFVYQARAFLEEAVGIDETASLPRCASFDEGVRNMLLLDAVVRSAEAGGASVDVPSLAELVA